MSPVWLKTELKMAQHHLRVLRVPKGKEVRVTMASGTPLPELILQTGRPVPSLVNSQNYPPQGGLGSTGYEPNPNLTGS
eukprot:1828858-Amphidinium_carterae.1